MERDREVQPQVCNVGTRELCMSSGFLWVPKSSCPSLASLLKFNWLKEVLHHSPTFVCSGIISQLTLYVLY